MLQDVPGTLAVDIRNRTGYLDVGSFQHLLEPVQFTVTFPDNYQGWKQYGYEILWGFALEYEEGRNVGGCSY